MKTPLTEGQEFRITYPFVLESNPMHDQDDTNIPEQSWKPGSRFEYDMHGGTDCWADNEGEMILTVVSVHKPGKFPERVFFKRKWIDPDGKEFGKSKLRMTTTAAFRSLCNGYRHKYELP